MCKTITFRKCDYGYRDILDNRDNFVGNIEIYFLALSHTPNVNVLILSSSLPSCLMRAHAGLLVICIYSYVVRKS